MEGLPAGSHEYEAHTGQGLLTSVGPATSWWLWNRARERGESVTALPVCCRPCWQGLGAVACPFCLLAGWPSSQHLGLPTGARSCAGCLVDAVWSSLRSNLRGFGYFWSEFPTGTQKSRSWCLLGAQVMWPSQDLHQSHDFCLGWEGVGCKGRLLGQEMMVWRTTQGRSDGQTAAWALQPGCLGESS